MQIDLSKPISAAKFAELVGVSRPAVSAMLSDGTLSKGDTAGEWLQGYLGQLRLVAAGRADTPQAQHSRERILAAEATRREEMARLATVKRKREERLVMPRSEVAAAVAALGATMKTKLWSWQGILPPLLENRSAREVASVLKEEARQLLAELSEHGMDFAEPLRVWVEEHAPQELLWTEARA